MQSGSICIGPKDKLGIVSHFLADRAEFEGVRFVCEDYGSMSAMLPQLTEVTEFTPEIVKRLINLLPKTAFGIAGKEFGMTGTDPEIFAFDSKGVVIPAWTWLTDKANNREFYYDGVQAELVTAPTTCHNYQTDAVRKQLLMLDNTLKRRDPKAYLATRDVVKLGRKLLMSAEDKYIELGCSPSSNAYPEVQPIDVGDPREHPYRYSGCHLHMSIMDIPMPSWFPHGTVAMMDKIVGLALCALGRGLEDPIRRIAYGRAGEFRVPNPQPANLPTWGDAYKDKYWTRLEYRTPGSFLLHHPALFNFAVDVARVAFRMGLVMDGRLLTEIPDVQGIINNCDADAANKLIQPCGSYFRKVMDEAFLGSAYQSSSETMSILAAGAQASGLFGSTVYDNWKLGGIWNGDNYSNGATRWQHFGSPA